MFKESLEQRQPYRDRTQEDEVNDDVNPLFPVRKDGGVVNGAQVLKHSPGALGEAHSSGDLQEILDKIKALESTAAKKNYVDQHSEDKAASKGIRGAGDPNPIYMPRTTDSIPTDDPVLCGMRLPLGIGLEEGIQNLRDAIETEAAATEKIILENKASDKKLAKVIKNLSTRVCKIFEKWSASATEMDAREKNEFLEYFCRYLMDDVCIAGRSLGELCHRYVLVMHAFKGMGLDSSMRKLIFAGIQVQSLGFAFAHGRKFALPKKLDKLFEGFKVVPDHGKELNGLLSYIIYWKQVLGPHLNRISNILRPWTTKPQAQFNLIWHCPISLNALLDIRRFCSNIELCGLNYDLCLLGFLLLFLQVDSDKHGHGGWVFSIPRVVFMELTCVNLRNHTDSFRIHDTWCKTHKTKDAGRVSVETEQDGLHHSIMHVAPRFEPCPMTFLLDASNLIEPTTLVKKTSTTRFNNRHGDIIDFFGKPGKRALFTPGVAQGADFFSRFLATYENLIPHCRIAQEECELAIATSKDMMRDTFWVFNESYDPVVTLPTGLGIREEGREEVLSSYIQTLLTEKATTVYQNIKDGSNTPSPVDIANSKCYGSLLNYGSSDVFKTEIAKNAEKAAEMLRKMSLDSGEPVNSHGLMSDLNTLQQTVSSNNILKVPEMDMGKMQLMKAESDSVLPTLNILSCVDRDGYIFVDGTHFRATILPKEDFVPYKYSGKQDSNLFVSSLYNLFLDTVFSQKFGPQKQEADFVVLDSWGIAFLDSSILDKSCEKWPGPGINLPDMSTEEYDYDWSLSNQRILLSFPGSTFSEKEKKTEPKTFMDRLKLFLEVILEGKNVQHTNPSLVSAVQNVFSTCLTSEKDSLTV